MSQNALLRSVKGLGAPGTARKEARKAKLKVRAAAGETSVTIILRFAMACAAPACI